MPTLPKFKWIFRVKVEYPLERIFFQAHNQYYFLFHILTNILFVKICNQVVEKELFPV